MALNMRKRTAFLSAIVGLGLISGPAVAAVYPPVVVTTTAPVVIIQPPAPTFAPTTAAPSTAAPSTAAPTTAAPSTATTSTVASTTAPTTAAPTTTIPTNVLPSASVQTPFSTGKAGLSKEFLAELKRFADVVKAANGKTVTITGFSPSSKKLATKRATDTRNALRKSLKNVKYVIKTSVKKGNPKSVQVTFQ